MPSLPQPDRQLFAYVQLADAPALTLTEPQREQFTQLALGWERMHARGAAAWERFHAETDDPALTAVHERALAGLDTCLGSSALELLQASIARRKVRNGDAAQSTMLEAATAACDRGWRIFPVKGKAPATPNGVKDATARHDVLHGRWGLHPDHGIGLATGAASGFFVLDVDGKEGSDALAALEAEHGPLPVTLGARTGHGMHFYLAMPADGCDVHNSVRKIGNGLDIKGTGGYVVMPPSPYPAGGHYEWNAPPDTTPIADAPAWLLERVANRESDDALPTGMPPEIGDRHPFLVREAVKLKRSGVSGAALSAKVAKINEDLPTPKPISEVERIIAWVDENVEASGGVLEAAGLTTLGDDPDLSTVEASLRRLSSLLTNADALQRAIIREAAIQAVRNAGIGSPARLVDAAFGRAPTADSNDSSLAFEDPEPWPDPVDGPALLDELAAVYAVYVAQPEEASWVEALWTLHAHAHDAAQVSPILAFTSATKRCGKTTAETVVRHLVPRPLSASNITPAALFRASEKYHPTIVVDEADTFIHEREELRGLLNSGHSRAAAFVIRCTEPDYEPQTFSTWAPKVIALIGQLPDTLADRSIEIRMRRRRPDEKVRRLRLDRLAVELGNARRKAARWAADHMTALRGADPGVPAGLNDRAADNWRPLLAIADEAGGEWPERARRAAIALSGAIVEDTDHRVQLLADLYDAFGDADRMASADATAALAKMEERPWPEWRDGQPITARQLAKLLKPYGIRPEKYRDEDDTVRGYGRTAFEDAWARYLPLEHPFRSGTSATAVQDNELGHTPIRNRTPNVPDSESAETRMI